MTGEDRTIADFDRRAFLRAAAGGAAGTLVPGSIARALALPADRRSGTIGDVAHVVILMMENRSFDHYFGTLRGVRGFGDRHPIPLPDGKSVWQQSDGMRDILPFRFDTRSTSALCTPPTPHTFMDAQAAWGQGRLCEWPRFKTDFAMGHYVREDIPFQFALADAFTICDAYHCSVATGTDPNRIMFWSGANFDPRLAATRQHATIATSEANNLRCWVKGALPQPGYTYQGSAFTWPTIPDVLERAGVSWRIYQDPNDNWTGAMHGCLAFESFRNAKPGSGLYENGMRHWSLDRFAEDARTGRLPAVSWILPPMDWSEHPTPSSPIQGAEFTSRVLDALTANPDVWGKTLFLLTFDENDGLFDHVPPPALPSINLDGSIAGKTTLDPAGLYFEDVVGDLIDPRDAISGKVRPWGLGARVPAYLISPWSRGGWVCSETFDHTSIGQFIEKRFGVTVPAISAWHRAVAGDLTGALDFDTPNDPSPISVPRVTQAEAILQAHRERPRPEVPTSFVVPRQEAGARASRALPYILHVDAQADGRGNLALAFHNRGQAGAVFHVYDRLHLDRIPRRYTVEAGKMLVDRWSLAEDDGRYDLFVTAPGGFMRSFSAKASRDGGTGVEVELRYAPRRRSVDLTLRNHGSDRATIVITDAAYGSRPHEVAVRGHGQYRRRYDLSDNGNWYDLVVTAPGYERRLAGRLETGHASISDPATGTA